MQLWNGLADVPSDLGATVATLGNFDGVHRGHRAVLEQVVGEASQRGVQSVAVTFDPHPIAVLYPERAPKMLASLEDRLTWIESAGIDACLLIEFTKELAQQTPEEFVKATFVDTLHVSGLVVGADTRFGVKNSGDINTLRELGETYGFSVLAVEDILDEVPGHETGRLSSTTVRALVAEGDVAAAAKILGRPHSVTGEVVHGNHRGHELGFPTANLSAESQGLVPAEGVYAGWLTRLDLADDAVARTMPAAISLGKNPTFETHDRRTVEAYVLDRDDLDLYGEKVRIEFVEHLRPTLKFDSIDALITQMVGDVDQCREILATYVPS